MPRTFNQRVQYAITGIINQEDSRQFDNCFEMYDGTAVVIAIWRKAIQSEQLMIAVNRMFCNFIDQGKTHPWQITAEKYIHIKDENLPKFAAELRNKANSTQAEMNL